MVSEQTPFSTFIDLVAFDQGLRRLHGQIEQLEQAKREFQDQQNVIEVQKIQAKDRVHQLCKEVDKYELRMKELDAHLKEKKPDFILLAIQKSTNQLTQKLILLKASSTI